MSETIHHNSSHFEPISHDNLSPAQAQVVAALAQGQTVSAAAREAGIHRTTVHHWLRTVPDFQAAAETAQSEYIAEQKDAFLELAGLAVNTLHDLLQDPTTPPAIRLKTALAVLQRNADSLIPEPVPESVPEPVPQPAPPIAAGAPEPAAAPTPAAPPAEPIARGGPCPCGSGLKYKRCCGPALHRLTPPLIRNPHAA